jgi:hypothetical protein
MRIAGNLDVEVTWARMDAAARRARGEKAPSPDDPRFALPEPVMRKISAAATLLRVFAQSDDDVLWTPRPVDPARMARVEWLPTPRLESGPVPETADVWWGKPSAAAMAANDRAFALRAAAAWKFGVPDAAIVTTLDDLRARADACRSWVAKAPFSAAGRSRALSMDQTSDDAPLRTAERLLSVYGRLRFEPWVRRTRDFGVMGIVRPGLVGIEGSHRLLVDRTGRFTGIEIEQAVPESTARLHVCASIVGHELDLAGYAGPFGVDGYLWTDDSGTERVVALGEVNARLTFGRVARDLATEIRPIVGLGAESPVTLRFGRGAPPPASIPLLLPGSDDDTSAWLEVAPRHGG